MCAEAGSSRNTRSTRIRCVPLTAMGTVETSSGSFGRFWRARNRLFPDSGNGTLSSSDEHALHRKVVVDDGHVRRRAFDETVGMLADHASGHR